MSNPVWYADSAPGGGVGTPLKCGGRIASFGPAAPTPLVVTTTPTDLGDRATVAPGTNPTLPVGGAAAVAAFLGFNTGGTIRFGGNDAIYGLSLPAGNQSQLSISCWLAPDGSQAQGSLLHSAFADLPGNNSTYEYSPNFNISPIQSGGVINGLQEVMHFADTVTGLSSIGTFTSGLFDLLASDLTGFSTSGYYHLMIAIKSAGANTQPTASIYVNDTAVFNGSLHGSISTGVTFGLPSAMMKDFPRVAPGDLSAYPHGLQNVWSIGSAFDNYDTNTGNDNNYVGAYPPDGRGLFSGVTELWIDIGQYVDWTSGANRNKFHTLDATLSHYIPVNLGSRGQTPLGSAPTVYCTGGPVNFTKNRSNGQRLSLYGGSGETQFVAGDGLVPLMSSDTRVPGV